MKPLCRRPVLLFGIIFTILIAVQGYYLWNTAKLWESEIYRDVHNRLDKLIASSDDKMKNTDDISSELIGRFEEGEISQNDFYENIKALQRSTGRLISAKIDSAFAEYGYSVGVEKQLSSVFLENSNKQLLDKPLILFRIGNNSAERKLLSTDKWTTNHQHRDTEHPVNDRDYKFTIKSEIYYRIENINAILFKKLAPQILLNLLLCGLILYVFSKTLKNLQRQNQKIAQLHTTIDSISHELNTPVTTMKFSVAGMQNAELKEFLERQISRIENIAGRIQHGTDDPALISNKEMMKYLQNIQKIYPEIFFDITLKFDFNKTLSAQDFELIFDNLIGNSAKYKATKIWVRALFNEEISLWIGDNGIGIPEGERAKIFEKYYRVSRPENLQIGGLGLGLFLVKETVKKYQGTVSVGSSPEYSADFFIKIVQNQ